jgi:hypothetical protein
MKHDNTLRTLLALSLAVTACSSAPESATPDTFVVTVPRRRRR